MTAVESRLRDGARLIDAALDRHLPPATEPPRPLHEAMRYCVFPGGKRLRPVLVLEAARAVGGDPSRVLPAACGVELVHTYSLVHDDLPCMDDDDLRRGRPSCHKVYGEALAVLAGDALLTHGFQLVAQTAADDAVPPARVAAAVRELARGAGSRGMVGGQVLDLAAEGRGSEVDAGLIEDIHRRKTAALFVAGLHIGGLLAGGAPRLIEALRDFGHWLGLAFQITDDLLDISGDPAVTGKPRGSDEFRGKATCPGVHGLEGARRLAGEAAARARAALDPLGEGGAWLAGLCRHIVDRDR